MGRSEITWNIKEIAQILRERQLNQYDCNIGVSGNRGDGKSTFIFNIFKRFKPYGFRQRKHQVYSQEDVKRLLANQKFGYCWDDEAINSGYKRDFQQVGQNELIKLVTNYRDNYNLYASALPFFYNLDKALRELIFMHVHIIRRGLGVILLPLSGQIHSQDPWDTATNKKVEAKENARLTRNPNVKFRFHKFTTFSGYVYFRKLTDKQKAKYQEIKAFKRAKAFENIEKDEPARFIDKVYGLLLEGKLTNEGIMQAALMEGKKYNTILGHLNYKLKNDSRTETVGQLLKKPLLRNNSNFSPQITKLVPDI